MADLKLSVQGSTEKYRDDSLQCVLRRLSDYHKL